MRVWLFVILFIVSPFVFANEPPKVLRYFAADQHTFQFVTDVLKLGISKNPSLKYTELRNLHYFENNEGRTLSLLTRDIIDIFWVGTSKQREIDYEPVRFPIIKGLLGYRVFLTHKDNLSKFDNISEGQLKQLVACQGISWPDTDILKSNGYTVATASKYIQLITLTSLKRCDYFPRAVYEGLNEIKWLANKYPNLRLVESVMLSYRFPIYFFLRKSDRHIAREIEKGLNQALNDGSYNQLFTQHDSLKYLNPTSQWHNKTIFHLTNPILPEKTPLNQKYWLNLSKSATNH